MLTRSAMKAFPARARRAAVCCAGLLLVSGTAVAQGFEQPWRGAYVGGGGNFSDVSVQVGSGCYDDYCWWGDYGYYEDGDGDYGYNVHVGWRVHDYVALEASYLETGTIRWKENLVYFPEFDDYYNNRVDFSAQVTELSVLGILPVSDGFEFYLRLGAGFWDGESVQRLDQSFGTDVVDRRVEDSGTGLLGGIGLGMTFAGAVHVRLEYQATTIDEDVLNARDDTSVDALLFELQYRFGARRAVAQPAGEPTATP